MKEEFTKEMHSELKVSKHDEECLRAGCVWHTWCNENSSKEDVEKYAKMYSISYEVAMKYKSYWLDKYGRKTK